MKELEFVVERYRATFKKSEMERVKPFCCTVKAIEEGYDPLLDIQSFSTLEDALAEMLKTDNRPEAYVYKDKIEVYESVLEIVINDLENDSEERGNVNLVYDYAFIEGELLVNCIKEDIFTLLEGEEVILDDKRTIAPNNEEKVTIYLGVTNGYDSVIFSNGHIALVYDADSQGKFDGEVLLGKDDTMHKLQEYMIKHIKSNTLNTFYENLIDSFNRFDCEIGSNFGALPAFYSESELRECYDLFPIVDYQEGEKFVVTRKYEIVC